MFDTFMARSHADWDAMCDTAADSRELLSFDATGSEDDQLDRSLTFFTSQELRSLVVTLVMKSGFIPDDYITHRSTMDLQPRPGYMLAS